jgi:hypothetical protein
MKRTAIQLGLAVALGLAALIGWLLVPLGEEASRAQTPRLAMCRWKDVIVRSEGPPVGVNVAASVYGLQIRNKGAEPCVLPPNPWIEVPAKTRGPIRVWRLIPGQYIAGITVGPHHRLRLGPGQSAELPLIVSRYCGNPRRHEVDTEVWIRAGLNLGGRSRSGDMRIRSCSRSGSLVGIGPISAPGTLGTGLP